THKTATPGTTRGSLFAWTVRAHRARPRIHCRESSRPQISPRMQPIEVLEPAVSDVFPVIHVRDHDVIDAIIGLPLRRLHGRAGPHDDEHYARRPRDYPLIVDLLDVLDVDAIAMGLLENDHRVF